MECCSEFDSLATLGTHGALRLGNMTYPCMHACAAGWPTQTLAGALRRRHEENLDVSVRVALGNRLLRHRS